MPPIMHIPIAIDSKNVVQRVSRPLNIIGTIFVENSIFLSYTQQKLGTFVLMSRIQISLNEKFFLLYRF